MMLSLPLCRATRFVLVRPHYPENVGASARAMKTMGLTQLALVRPGRLAQPQHEMAFKMAVKAWDVLDSAQRYSELAEALRGYDTVFATTSRRGTQGTMTPDAAAQMAHHQVQRGQQVAVVFGNEKTGLTGQELECCQYAIRIPMAAAQPSVNLAQSCQIIAYEWFRCALAARQQSRPEPNDV
jgi:tRNA (cytidine32/uridine32-2'-O)-methyltransferase